MHCNPCFNILCRFWALASRGVGPGAATGGGVAEPFYAGLLYCPDKAHAGESWASGRGLSWTRQHTTTAHSVQSLHRRDRRACSWLETLEISAIRQDTPLEQLVDKFQTSFHSRDSYIRDRLIERMARTDQLPTELLLAVFLLLRDHHPTSWTRVLLVCHRWYEVAVTAPTLWTKLAIDTKRCGPDHFATLLQRSEALELDLSLDVHSIEFGLLFDVLRSHAGRIRSLLLRFSAEQTTDLQRHLESVSHTIRSLTLYCLASEAPKLLMNPQAFPFLCSLRATQILPRPKRQMPGVTYLALNQVWHAVHSGDDVAQHDLLTTLDAFPALETLVLHDALPPCMSVGNATMAHATLSKLRLVEVNETFEDIELFLGHVTMPAEAHLTIVARVAEAMWEPEQAGVLLGILPENYQTNIPMIRDSRALQLFAGHTDDGPLTFKGFPDEDVQQTEAWTIIFPDCGETLPEALPVALLELPRVIEPSALIHLELHTAPHVLLFDLDWKAVLEPFSHLRKLCVGSVWKAEDVVTMLYRHQDVLPELIELELCLDEVKVDPRQGPLPPPGDMPPRFVERILVMQPDHAPEPYFEGTLLGSMLRSTHYRFKHSSCSACHVKGRVLLDAS
ncbi:hypothetical protein OH77DRAFT_619288 [Trametes cingulata]|nr:hypothetical protein OH77DRAFT_619288 [Trametes cingulata]